MQYNDNFMIFLLVLWSKVMCDMHCGDSQLKFRMMWELSWQVVYDFTLLCVGLLKVKPLLPISAFFYPQFGGSSFFQNVDIWYITTWHLILLYWNTGPVLTFGATLVWESV